MGNEKVGGAKDAVPKFEIIDENHNGKVDGGDTLKITRGGSSAKFKVDEFVKLTNARGMLNQKIKPVEKSLQEIGPKLFASGGFLEVWRKKVGASDAGPERLVKVAPFAVSESGKAKDKIPPFSVTRKDGKKFEIPVEKIEYVDSSDKAKLRELVLKGYVFEKSGKQVKAILPKEGLKYEQRQAIEELKVKTRDIEMGK